MWKWQHKALSWSLAMVLIGTLAAGTQVKAAVDIASLLKLFGISYVVDMFSKELDGFINTVTLNKGLGKGEATKVVPIVSAGTGAYVGAAQVTGPAAQVARVQAVGQLEGAFFANALRAKALVPLDNKNPLQGLKRVDSVGVSAIIDITIESSNPPVQTKPTPKPTLVPPPVTRDPAPSPVSDERQVLQRYPALGYAMFAGEDIQLTGNNVAINGDIRANDDITIRCNNFGIKGQIMAGDKVDSNMKLGHGDKHDKYEDYDDDDDGHDGTWKKVSGLNLPRFNWTDLQKRAGRVYSGSITLKAGSSLQGVLAVDGNLLIDGKVQGGGVVIVRGNVTITNRGAGADRGLLVWAGGDVQIPESGAGIDAVLLSDRNIKVTANNVQVRGGLIGRNVYLSGNSFSIFDDSSAIRYLP